MAKVDWKAVAKSDGYKSLKSTVAKEHARTNRMNQRAAASGINVNNKTDSRYREKFKEIIQAAIQHFEVNDIPVEDSLNEWESKRTYSFLNYYQFEYGKPVKWLSAKRKSSRINYLKKRSGNKKRKGSVGWGPRNNIDRLRIVRDQAHLSRSKNPNKKPRWTPAKKERRYKYGRIK